jgi:predicted TIM-barrel fold metal-dependent hydrolase
MSAAFPIVDAHQHFWDLGRNRYPWLSDPEPPPFRYGDTRPLRRDYLPPDYRRDARAHEVVMTVHMEAEVDPARPVAETEWLEEIAAAHGIPTACVAQARLDRADAGEVLAAQAAHPIVRGIRHKPEPGQMASAAWRRGYARLAAHGLSFDLQAPWTMLAEAAELAAAFPGTLIVINHAGLPADRSEDGLAGWRRALRLVAACPNAALKISGLGLPGREWTLADNGPVIRDAIGIFGAARCMFASNFPVDGLCATFDRIFSGFREAVADLPPAQQRALFHDNAVRIYRLA